MPYHLVTVILISISLNLPPPFIYVIAYMTKVAGSPLFVRRIFRSVSCRWRATFGPQKKVLGRPPGVLNCSKDGLMAPPALRGQEKGAVVAGLLLVRDTSALQQQGARVTSLLVPTLLPPPPLNPRAVSKVVAVVLLFVLLLQTVVVTSLSMHRRSSGIRRLAFRRNNEGDDDDEV